MKSIGVEETPAIVVMSADFEPIRKFTGEFEVAELAKVLRVAGGRGRCSR